MPPSGTKNALLDNGTLYVDGIRFDDIDIESMPYKELHAFNRAIRNLQLAEIKKFRAAYPESPFITTAEYQDRKMWHSAMVTFAARRKKTDAYGNIVLDKDGDPMIEHGYTIVDHNASPDSYTLRDAIVRLYRSPSYAEYILEEADEYQSSILQAHPDITVDVTDDLSTWVSYDSSGEIVGWYSLSKYGNH